MITKTSERQNVGSPFVVLNNKDTLFDNTNQFSRISYRRNFYFRFVLSALLRIRMADMLRCHFPFLLPDLPRPAFVTVEFTNYCNLQCPYCTSPLALRPQGMMSEEVFAALVRQVEELKVSRVRIVGNGEATLHPRFAWMVTELAKVCGYLTLVTNGQRLDRTTIVEILRAPLRLIEVSVDSSRKDSYERVRLGASYEKLLNNLVLLKEVKRELNAPVLINIRVMIHPSERPGLTAILDHWRDFGDTVVPQFLHDEGLAGRTNTDDLFRHSEPQHYPRCTLPLKALDVCWNGDVPLCDFADKQTGKPGGLLLGNVARNTLQELWNHGIIRQYRQGHRERDPDKMPICRGCVGA
jgi:MoaA/NifB/PqqE/SkfB family radical SAM enzyme